MARKQYRWRGTARWQSQVGNAVVALTNTPGSGKKFLVHSVEVGNFTRGSAAATGNMVGISLVRGITVGGGDSVPLVPRDTQASVPDGVTAWKNCGYTGTTERMLRTAWFKNLSIGSVPFPQRAFGTPLVSWADFRRYETTNESLTLNPTEHAALVIDANTTSVCSQLLQVSGTIVAYVFPGIKRSFDFDTLAWAGADAAAIIAFRNDGVEFTKVLVKNLSVQEVGTADTPYFRVVPVGAINSQNAADDTAKLSPVPMDSAYGAFEESIGRLTADAPMLPFGVPAEYISESSVGTPKGFNYLHTKDFAGPQWSVLFPEHNRFGIAGSDSRLLPSSNRSANILGFRDAVVLREGEGMAVVSSAEFATVATNFPVGRAGTGLYEIAITFSVENAQTPYLTLTGVQPGSDIAVLDAGTETIIAGSGSLVGSTFTWQYDQDIYSSIDIAVYRAGFVPFVIRGLSIDGNGATIPVAQIQDRNYSNP